MPLQTAAPKSTSPLPAEDSHYEEDTSSEASNECNEAAPPMEQGETGYAQQLGETVREQDRFLPIANVAKVMTRQLSDIGFAKIAHDAKMAMQEAVTEFICFGMSEANDQAVKGKRKTVAGSDIANTCYSMGEPSLSSPQLLPTPPFLSSPSPKWHSQY